MSWFCSSHVLAELQGFHRPDRLALDAVNHRRNRLKVFLDDLQPVGGDPFQMSDHARDVFPHGLEQASFLWLLQLAHQLRIQVVETHRRQGIERRAKHRHARRCHQRQTIGGHRRKGHLAAGFEVAALDTEKRTLADTANHALLELHLVAAARQRADVEGVVAGLPVAQRELEPNAEVRRVTTGAPPHLVQSATFVQRIVERSGQSVPYEVQCVQEIALARSVGTHQIGEWIESHVAVTNALVVAQDHTREKNRTTHPLAPSSSVRVEASLRLADATPCSPGSAR